MNRALEKAWGGVLKPMLRRPKRLQVAALCHRKDGADRRYLLVTSRDTRRWIIPKGWPIRGLKSNETAMQEAWEEAGVRNGRVSHEPIGCYSYEKRRATGLHLAVETLVYEVAVDELQDQFPEAHERDRKWVTAAQAANMVEEPELQQMFTERVHVNSNQENS